MTASRQTRIRRQVAGAAFLALLTLTGCGDETPPSESAPAVGDSLDRVDAAIEAGELDKARRAVKDLIAKTAEARVDGDITDEQADAIFDAAREVLAELR